MRGSFAGLFTLLFFLPLVAQPPGHVPGPPRVVRPPKPSPKIEVPPPPAAVPIPALPAPEPTPAPPRAYYYDVKTDVKIRQKYLPRLAHREHNRKMREAVLYDKKVRWRVHQDATATGFPRVLGSQYNISFPGPVLDHRGEMKRDRFGNGNLEFPWKHTGGVTDETPVKTVNLLWLPPGESIDWQTQDSNYVAWAFPIGTTFYEVLINETNDLPFTVRVRTKTAATGPWQPDEFVPFPSRTEYEEALKAKSITPQAGPIVRPRIASRHPSACEDLEGDLETLAPLDPGVVKELLDRPFRSRLVAGTWSESAMGVTAEDPGQIVPPKYHGQLVEVTTASCNRCHRDTGKHVEVFERNPPRDWYGLLRGGDGILSWHPFEDRQLRDIGFDGAPWQFDPVSRRLMTDPTRLPPIQNVLLPVVQQRDSIGEPLCVGGS